MPMNMQERKLKNGEGEVVMYRFLDDTLCKACIYFACCIYRLNPTLYYLENIIDTIEINVV